MSVKLSSEARSSERLAERRRQRRRRVLMTFGVLLVFMCGGVVYELNQEALRISHVQMYGAEQSYADIATDAMRGSYLGIIPRDSTFFFPASRIRGGIIDTYPGVAAVSIFRNGLTGLSIKVDDRVAIARWCGASDVASDSDADCFVFDASGYIYAASATTTETVNSFSLYAPLSGDALEPLRATVAGAEKLPTTFDFARQLATFGVNANTIVLRDDEVDVYVKSGTPSTKSDLVLGTRITYVLGREQDAFTALVSASANLDLADGSLDYVDLRFDGKVYMKRR